MPSCSPTDDPHGPPDGCPLLAAWTWRWPAGSHAWPHWPAGRALRARPLAAAAYGPAGRGVRCVPERPASTAPHRATLACATSGRVPLASRE